MPALTPGVAATLEVWCKINRSTSTATHCATASNGFVFQETPFTTKSESNHFLRVLNTSSSALTWPCHSLRDQSVTCQPNASFMLSVCLRVLIVFTRRVLCMCTCRVPFPFSRLLTLLSLCAHLSHVSLSQSFLSELVNLSRRALDTTREHVEGRGKKQTPTNIYIQGSTFCGGERGGRDNGRRHVDPTCLFFSRGRAQNWDLPSRPPPPTSVTCPRCRDNSDHHHGLRTRCEIHKSQLQDGHNFLHEHVPRDQILGNDLIHDLLMNEKVWHVRIDPERVEIDLVMEPRRCVCVGSVIWKLTKSRCIAEGLSKVAHTGERWSEHSTNDSGTELVTAVLQGLKQQLQDDELLIIHAFEPRMTGHDLQTWEEIHVKKFCNELLGAPMDPDQE